MVVPPPAMLRVVPKSTQWFFCVTAVAAQEPGPDSPLRLKFFDDVLYLLRVGCLRSEAEILLIMCECAVVVSSFDQSVRQIEMSDRVVGSAGDCTLVLFDLSVLVTLLSEQQGKIEVCLGVVPLD